MARLITLESSKTYATWENAVRAVEKTVTNPQLANLRYFIQRGNDGRYFPVFVGQDCLQHGIHQHFSVVA